LSGYLRILTVCSFNRARSVAMVAHLRHSLKSRPVDAHVVGVGFGPPGEPPIPEVTAALAHIGIDVAGYRSRTVDPATVAGADLIITAERIHVVRLCEDHRELFPRAFTLPELVLRAEAAGPRGGVPIGEWLTQVGAGRAPADFIGAAGAGSIPEIADPTGLADVAVGAAVADIGEWCRRLAVLL
jgi:protein-tyrosine phosphatase